MEAAVYYKIVSFFFYYIMISPWSRDENNGSKIKTNTNSQR